MRCLLISTRYPIYFRYTEVSIDTLNPAERMPRHWLFNVTDESLQRGEDSPGGPPRPANQCS